MRILLDTCEFLWLVTGDAKLSPNVASAVRDPENEVFLSAVSFWEISLKYGLGKLPLPQPPAQFVPQQREKHQIAPLALDETAVAQLGKLPPLHRDPFDRMLVCQAQAHGLTLASSDYLVRQYPVALLPPKPSLTPNG
jgi:PIN domain nuclease of toxin-antitoxin system